MNFRRPFYAALQRLLRMVGRRNQAFAWVIKAQPSHADRSIFARTRGMGRLWSIFKRLLVKVGTFDEPILTSVNYFDGEPLEPSSRKLFSITLDATDYTQLRYYFEFPDPALRDLILHGGRTFVDVGANVGVFSLLAANYFETVLAFEPLPPIFELLAANVASQPNVTAQRIALSNRDGVAAFNQNALGSGGSSLESIPATHRKLTARTNWNVFDVTLARADSVIRNVGPIDLIKIDVEGHEPRVVLGARDLILRDRPILFIEIHTDDNFHRIRSSLPPGVRTFDPVRRVFTEERAHPDTLFVWPNRLATIERVFGARG